MRINRYIASSGLCSRRHAEELIRQGRVRLNGEKLGDLGREVGPEDHVSVDGRAVKPEKRHVYILLNKPRGVLTSMSDPHGRRTVADLVEVPERVVPVGRLDLDSSGALLLTNDGELSNRLLHPSGHVEKEYLLLVDRPLTEPELERFRKGIKLDDRRTAPAEIEAVGRSSKHARYRVVLREGRNRQLRRMMAVLGVKVRRLTRRQFAGLDIRSLEPGQWIFLGQKEVDRMRRSIGKEPA